MLEYCNKRANFSQNVVVRFSQCCTNNNTTVFTMPSVNYIIQLRRQCLFLKPYIAGPQSVVTFYLRLYFPSAHFQTKPNKVFFVCRLIEVKNDGRTLVGIAKRWPRPLSKGGPLMEAKLQCYSTIVFGTLITGRLIKGGRLMGSRLTEVQYFMID